MNAIIFIFTVLCIYVIGIGIIAAFYNGNNEETIIPLALFWPVILLVSPVIMVGYIAYVITKRIKERFDKTE